MRAGGGHSNNGNIAKVQDAINRSLADDLRRTLGGDFFTGIRFNLVRITLPLKVQTAGEVAPGDPSYAESFMLLMAEARERAATLISER